MTTDEMVVDVSQDWVLACDVQQRFMNGPGRKTGPTDYSGQCRQVRALGGDCYEFAPLADDSLALTVGDASGKGVAAALMMASVQASLRTAAVFTGNDLAALFNIVNLQAYHSSLANRFATLFHGVFEKATRTLRYVNAGHNPPLVLCADGSVRWLEPEGAPIGMLPDSNHQENVAQLNAGDLVIAYSDGVIEATNPEGEEWGVEGLLRATAKEAQCPMKAEDVVKSIFNSLDDFSRGRQTDDATLAVLRV